MIKKAKIFLSSIVGLSVLVATNTTAAAVSDINIKGATGDLTTYIERGLNTAIWIAGILSAIFIIVGGFQYITAGSSKDGASKAKQTLTYAIIGLVIVLLAVAIRGFVLRGLNIDESIIKP